MSCHRDPSRATARNSSAGGHTHIQMLRRYQDVFVLNPGSVGLAYEHVPWPSATVRNPPWGELRGSLSRGAASASICAAFPSLWRR